MDRASIEKMINEAVSAPSGENCQPWRFEVSGSLIRVFNIPERDASLYNFGQRGSYVAHGALLENISVLAGACGFTAEIKIFTENSQSDLIAEVNLIPVSSAASPLAPFVLSRATNRKPYHAILLTPEEESELRSATQNDKELEQVFLIDPEKKQRAAQALSVNEKLLFQNRFLHDFFFSHIRWNAEEERRQPNGFFIKTLELLGPQEKALGLFRHWPLLRVLNFFGVSRQIAKDNAKNYASSAALVAITASRHDNATFIEAGRIFQRLWLTATKLKLGFQPVTGILFFMQRINGGAGDNFSPKEITLIQDAYQTLQEVFGAKGREILLIFRIGKADAPRARSGRLTPEIKFI